MQTKVLIIEDDHVDKTLMDSLSRTWVKNGDALMSWTKESVGKMESAEKHTVAEMEIK